MANNFFSRFPTVDYDMDGQGSLLTLTDFTANVDVNDFFANHSAYYTYYDILDGERPDTISYKLYENPNYYWTFFILNNDLRGGLSSAWPLSSNQFESMMTREYDDYSVISFLPQNGSDINGIDISGLFPLTYLDEAYLPYLRLTNESKSEWATILKYDSALLQIVISNIEKSDGTGLPNSITPYLSNSHYKLVWANPFEEDTDEYTENEVLKKEYVDKMISVYSEIDESAIIDESTLDSLPTQAEIDAAIIAFNNAYVFGKQFTPAPSVYRWASYRNAAAEYYTEDSEGNVYSASAFDVLSDPNVITPKYISNFEKEDALNSKKEKIRVIRKDRIVDFINTYFTTLNS